MSAMYKTAEVCIDIDHVSEVIESVEEDLAPTNKHYEHVSEVINRSGEGEELTRLPHAKGITPTRPTLQCAPFPNAHPAQNKPTTIPTPPIMAVYKRCSGAAPNLPSAKALWCWGWYMYLSTMSVVAAARRTPMPTEINVSPDWETVKEYGGREKMKGNAAKKRKRVPKAKEVYREKKNTAG